MQAKPSLRRHQLGLLALMLLSIVSSFVLIYHFASAFSASFSFTACVLDMVGMIIATLLYFNCCQDTLGEEPQFRIFRLLLVINFLSLALDYYCVLLERALTIIPVLYPLNYASYFSSVAFMFAIFRYVQSLFAIRKEIRKRLNLIANIILVLEILVILSNVFTHHIFIIAPPGVFQAQPTEWLCYPYFFILLVFCAATQVLSDTDFQTKRSLMLSLLIPLLIVVLNLFRYYLSCVFYLGMQLSLLFIYGNIYVQRGWEILHQRNELTQTQLHSMLHQIDPHLIYNTLGSISALCQSNPEKAAQLTDSFSAYLRSNFNDIATNDVIHFEDEIDHLAHYISIEKVRFPGISVRYDLDITDFMLPSLSIQPLVENAIVHGIQEREDGVGTVSISTGETDTDIIIRITDNGVGFSKEELIQNRDLPEIGIPNVRKRLEMLFKGTLEVRSVPNLGTICTITLPKSEQVLD